MRWKWEASRKASVNWLPLLCVLLYAIGPCDSARAQRRQDVRRRQFVPAPSVETLTELAEAMGAAGFEHYTEGNKAIVKRLIPDTQTEVDEVTHQGIVGKPGVDFPAFPNIPATGFNCKNVATGYYADLETDCQVFHICDTHRKISFLCPNGTIFSQSHLICDWWFKVDCASSPALYESSAEFYSQEQKKRVKASQLAKSFKNSDLQQISADASNINMKTQEREQPRRPSNSPKQDTIGASTERQTNRFRPLKNFETVLPTNKPTSRSFGGFTNEVLFNVPTQRTFNDNKNSIDNRRKNLVQLIANNFGNPQTARTTLPSYTDAAVYRATVPAFEHNNLREMQETAESAAFANNNNRQYFSDLNKVSNDNVKQYPVYSPTPSIRTPKPKTTQSTLTTLFVHDIRDQYNQQSQTTKRPTLLPYTKKYDSVLNTKHEPYTRPGIHLLKDYLHKEKNKTASKTVDNNERKDYFETVTKFPTSAGDGKYFTAAASSDQYDIYSKPVNNINLISTEPTYHERRERLTKRLNFSSVIIPTVTPRDTSSNSNNEDANKERERSPPFVIPPSLTPQTLHSLAIYYATALDNLSNATTDFEDQITTMPPNDNGINEDLPTFLSKQTIQKYGNLFNKDANTAEDLEQINFDLNTTSNELSDDLSAQQSQGPLASSPQIRELAQVFTHALSAYLQDPVQFRKVLSDIRPTHPSFPEMITTPNPATTTADFLNPETTTTFTEEEDEILGFSDENKSRPPALAQLREAKRLNIPVTTISSNIDESVTTYKPTTVIPINTQTSTTKLPFKCCGSISASYTSASTPVPPTTSNIQSRFVDNAEIAKYQAYSDNSTYNTEDSYAVPKYGGFQNNSQSDSPYGKDFDTNAKPVGANDYIEATNLPIQWGEPQPQTTYAPLSNSQNNAFEVNNLVRQSDSYGNIIQTTTESTTQFFTETDSSEIENEEELQRAHSQSFVPSQNNNVVRQGKTIKNLSDGNYVGTNVKKPSEELEAPTTYIAEGTSARPKVLHITTQYPEENRQTTAADNISTNAESDVTTYSDNNKYQWSNSFDNWHSTVILDPITLNDGLSAANDGFTSPEGSLVQNTRWQQRDINVVASTTTPVPEYNRFQYITSGSGNTAQAEQNYTPNSFDSTSPERTQSTVHQFSRVGKLLQPTEIPEPSLTTVLDEKTVEKAKEIMGEMNITTADKLMDVMKKTKSKTVRRLILLLVQTCDDDHNKTAEASKRALLDALMTVSKKEMDNLETGRGTESPYLTSPDDSTFRVTNTYRRMDRLKETPEFESLRNTESQRSGKSYRFDAGAINSLTNTVTSPATEAPTTLTTTSYLTTSTTSRPALSNRRGVRKYLVRTSPVEVSTPKATPTAPPAPVAEARIAESNSKVDADTRALELLRSLYTIAAKWG